MRKYITYKRVSGGENQKSGLGLDAQERDIQLFLENYSEMPFEVLAEFVEVQTGTDNERPPTPCRHRSRKAAPGNACRCQVGSPIPKGLLHRFSDGREGSELQGRPDALRRRLSTPHLCSTGVARTTVHLPENKGSIEGSEETWSAFRSTRPSH